MNPTQEIIKRLFLSIAISVATLIAGTSVATAAVTRCGGDFVGDIPNSHLKPGTYDTVLVPKGKTCEVVDGTVTVEQNVILQEGASLFGPQSSSVPFTVNGNLLGDG